MKSANNMSANNMSKHKKRQHYQNAVYSVYNQSTLFMQLKSHQGE